MLSSWCQSLLAQCGEAAGWRCGASEVVDEDVDAAHAIECFGDRGANTLGRGEVGGNEQLGVDVLRLAARGDEHDCAGCREAPSDRRAGAFGAAADERTAAVQIFRRSLYRRYTRVVSSLQNMATATATNSDRKDLAARDRLLLAATQLLDEAAGGPVSTREITERAGVRAPTLYHHFGSKQACWTRSSATVSRSS